MQITKNNKNELVLTFEYSAALVEIVKHLDSRKYNDETKEWTIPMLHIVKVLDTLTPFGFHATIEVLEYYNKAKNKKRKIERIKTGKFKDTEKEILKKTNLPLFDFQKIGTGFLVTCGSALVGDEPGLGKTIQSLGATIITKSRKNLIVCPSTIKRQWQEEVYKWIPNSIIYLVEGNKEKRNKIYEEAKKQTKRFYLIINYELLLRDIEKLQEF